MFPNNSSVYSFQPFPNGPSLIAKQGDLVQEVSDVLVNPANGSLQHGGGVARALAEAAGEDQFRKESENWIKRHGSLRVGNIAVTSAGNLPGRRVIHVRGPCVNLGERPSNLQESQLRSVVRKSLRHAEANRMRSISMPLISSGIFNYPKEMAAQTMVLECVDFIQSEVATKNICNLKQIILVNIDEKTTDILRSVLSRVAESPTSSLSASSSSPFNSSKHSSSFQGDSFVPEFSPSFSPQHSARSSRYVSSPFDAPVPMTANHSCSMGSNEIKAAGVLPFRSTASTTEVLLAVEYRSSLQINFLGGQSDLGESPFNTAVREFHEETGKLLCKNDIKRRLLSGTDSEQVWCQTGKYMLWVCDSSPLPEMKKLPSRYESMRKNGGGFFGFGNLPHGAEAKHLVWVSWRQLLSSIEQKSPHLQVNVAGGSHGADRYKSFPLSSFLIKVLKTTELRHIMSNMVSKAMKHDLEREIERVRSNQQKSRPEKSKLVLGGDDSWKLNLNPLKALPPPAIQLLSKTDPEYKEVAKHVPEAKQNKIISIRKVQVNSRKQIFEKEKSNLTNSSNFKKKVRPVYHGTPERWRATAIATHGFDTSIKLNGRAKGDGVYSAKNISVPLSYSREQGSVLYMQGLVKKEDDVSGSDQQEIYVFRDPKRVLPEYIVDFATSQDEKENEEQEIYEQHQKARKELEDMNDAVRKQESNFMGEASHRLDSSSTYYLKRLMQFKENLNDDSIWRPFYIEKQQFNSMLPIYAKKEEIITSIQKNDVVVLMSDTGSGKSTQVPQYILDHVMSSQESRRIAVLQPRRVNAVSLCMQVSKERGEEAGGEVGYSLGLGDNLGSDKTRIEFMTHGLFANIAQTPKRLLDRYSAVIIDEVHERSVNVDLSLALLRRALEKYPEQTSPKFPKIIIMSATIENQSQELLQYFNIPDVNLRREEIKLSGHSFPVLVQHRNDVVPDSKVVGSAGAGAIIASNALQVALDILQKTKDGNVLVFMQGESQVRSAVRNAKMVLLESEGDKFKLNGISDQDYGEGFEAEVKHQFGDHHSLKPNTFKVIVNAFYGKMSEASRDRVLNPKDDTRIIVFSTNIAETGLTIPNVRFVIDTGYERRVSFNWNSGTKEMATEPITKSSMKQRMGRAGRTGSGICVRLYSQETENNFADCHSPQIKGNQPLKTILYMQKVQEEDKGKPLTLPEPIPKKQLNNAKKMLQLYGAIDNSEAVTEQGNNLKELGIDVQLGRFLIACQRLDCLDSGVKLAAMLVTDSFSHIFRVINKYHKRKKEKRDKKKPLHGGAKKLFLQELKTAERLERLISNLGDHLTLVNVFEDFNQSYHNKLSWCKDHDIPYKMMMGVEHTYDHLCGILSDLNIDHSETQTSKSKRDQNVMRALCAAFFHNIAVARKPGVPGERFSLLLDSSREKDFVSAMQSFSQKHSPLQEMDNNNNNNNTGDSATSENGNSQKEVKLSKEASTLHISAEKINKNSGSDQQDNLSTSSSHQQQQQGNANDLYMIVFDSIMLTDSTQSASSNYTILPTIQVASWIRAEDVENAAKEWCKNVEFEKMLDKSRPVEESINITKAEASILKQNNGFWLNRWRRRFPSYVISLVENKNSDKKPCIKLSAPLPVVQQFKRKLRQRLSKLRLETVNIVTLDSEEKGKFIGKNGEKKKKLNNDLKEIAQNALGIDHSNPLALHEKKESKHTVRVDVTDEGIVQLSLNGSNKELMDVFIGRIRSHLAEHCGYEIFEDEIQSNDGQLQQVQKNPRLMDLATSQRPNQRNYGTRDYFMLFLAHAVIWNAQCDIYGGFVRDWVIRGKSANDIDVAVPDGQTTQKVDILKNAIQKGKLTCEGPSKKGSARTLTFKGNFSPNIEIDLVESKDVKKVAEPPYVDADIDNLKIQGGNGNLVLKVPNQKLLPLHKSIKHARDDSFVFYYYLAPNKKSNFSRLKKLLDKKMNCLSPVPNALYAQLSDQQKACCKPEAKFNQSWWEF